MYIWYSPDDGHCEVWDYNPCELAGKYGPSDSVLMIPPEGWDCE